MRRIFYLLIFTVLSATLTAGGFQVGLQGQKQTSMGLIGTGITFGASSVFFNPGALTFLEKDINFSFGISPIISSVAFQAQSPLVYEATTDNPVGLPFSFYASGKLGNKWAIGLGVYTPFGSSTVWDDNWKGKYIIQDISLFSIYIQPTVAYKISDKLGIGAGFVYAYGKVNLSKAIPVQGYDAADGKAELEGTSGNFGFNAGLSYRPTDKLEFGLTYRSKICMKVEGGDATFTVPASLSTSFPSPNTFDSELPLPSSINLGFSYIINDKFTIGADFHYVMWSAYDSLVFDFKENTSSLEDSRNPRLYKDNFIFRVGAQYIISEKIAVRAGAYYDSPAVEDNYYAPETPDATKIGLSTGLSWSVIEGLDIDASFLYVMGLEREVGYEPANFWGTYKYNAFIPGIGVSYGF